MRTSAIGTVGVVLFALLSTEAASAAPRAKAPKRRAAAVRVPQEEPPTPAPAAIAAPTEHAEAKAPPPAPPTPPPKDVAPVSAETPVAPERPISVAPLLGYASGGANFGLGARGGYTLNRRIYIGGTFVFHLGSSSETTDVSGAKVESSARLFYPGVEVGYDVPIGPVRLRPYGGLGAMFVTLSSSAGGQSESDTKTSAAFWPGCSVSYDVPSSAFFVGGDVRLVIATSGGDPSFGTFLTGGARF